MALIGYREPSLVMTGALKEPRVAVGVAAQNAVWRRGAILRNLTTGTISTPAPTGALAAYAGPASTAVTLGQTASASAPAATYMIAVTYTATGTESQVAYYTVNVPFGYVPSVNVATAGAPTGATNYAVYVATQPNYYGLQQATRTTTALGTAFNLSNPLVNNIGWASAPTATTTNIVGLAVESSDSTYFDGPGGSYLAGSPGSRLGAGISIPPLVPGEGYTHEVLGLGVGQIVEMSLLNTIAWAPSLIGTAAGLTLDATSGLHIVDPTQTACMTIVDQRDGVYIGPAAPGTTGDMGVRVQVQFYPTALIYQ